MTSQTTTSVPEPQQASLTETEFLLRLPKVELHCHFPGTISARTAVDLAAKNGVELPSTDPETLYDYDTIGGFLAALQAVSKVVITQDDFARVAYETLADGVTKGNLRYREMFFNPDYHYPQGVSYNDMVAGMEAGIQRARSELGVRCNLIAAISRYHGSEAATAMVRTVVEHPHPLVIGIGMDDLTPDGHESPELFADAYALAKAHGLRATAHISEIDGASPRNFVTARDVLGCDRIDHAYRILEDADVVARAIADGVHITTCPGSTQWVYGFPLAGHPIKAMFDRGLRVSINSDDPPFFDTDIGREYTEYAVGMGFSRKEIIDLCRNAIDGCWLSADEKGQLHEELSSAVAAMTDRVEAAPSFLIDD